MCLPAINEATKSSVALVPVQCDGVTDPIWIEILLRCLPPEGRALAKTCKRLYRLLFEAPVGNLVWTSFVAQSFPHLAAKNLKRPGQSLYQKGIELWDTCKHTNLVRGLHHTDVWCFFTFPLCESALVDENNNLLLCSANPLRIQRYNSQSEAPKGEIVQVPVCLDGKGHFLIVERGAVENVKLLNIETSAVLEQFSLGAGHEDLRIQRLCATDRFVAALARWDENDPLGFVFVWDRNQPEGDKAPKLRMEMESIRDIQVEDNLLYLLSCNPEDEFCDFDIWDFHKNECIEKHRLQYQILAQETAFRQIISFVVEDRVVIIKCDDQIPRLTTLDLNNPSSDFHNFFPAFKISHIQKGPNSWAVFPEEGNQVEFWNFSPHPDNFKLVIDDEFPTLFERFGLTTKEQYSQYFDCWPTALEGLGIFSSLDVAKILERGQTQVAPMEMLEVNIQNPHDIRELRAAALQKKEHLLACLQTLQSVAAMKQQEWSDRWSVKKPELMANPWTPILEKINLFCENLNKGCTSDKKLFATFEIESYSEIVRQMNTLIDAFNAAGAIDTLQRYICEPDLLRKWAISIYERGIDSLHALAESNPDLFQKFLSSIFD
jgi:hypothetical protein